MKGIVFSEFISMVETAFSPALADKIICQSRLAHHGAYTAVGTYHHGELVELVGRLGAETGLSSASLLKGFGEHLLARFVVRYPAHFAQHHDAFSVLAAVDDKIHVEVRKLYPDAELPSFEHQRPSPREMVLVYRSRRPFGDLAEGLIRGCIAHFGECISLRREDFTAAEGSHVAFTLSKDLHV